jgi:monovalent cation:H+ antiporter-2, CPA2 family
MTEPLATTEYFFIPLVMLAAAVLLTSLLSRLRISPVLGYLLAGLLIGPSGFGWIANTPVTQFLAELGVVFLLFAIGLELPLERLRVMRRWVFGFGGSTTILIFAAMVAVAFFWRGQFAEAVVIGAALMFSSTALLVQILSERGEFQTRHGRASFSASLFQDLMVAPILVAIPLLQQSDELLWQNLSASMVKAVLALLAIMYLGRWLLRPFYHFVIGNKNHESMVAMTLLVVLGVSVATYSLGLSLALGAFLAGVVLAETEFRHQIAADIDPFRGLLLGLFFMTVGMMLDVGFIMQNVPLLAVVVVLLIFTKVVIFYAAARIFALPPAKAAKAMLVLSQSGEFGFVVLAVAAQKNIIGADIINLLTAVIIVSMAVNVLLVRVWWGRLDKWQQTEQKPPGDSIAQEDFKDRKNHIVIIGFGRVGEVVAAMCAAQGLAHIVIDDDVDRIAQARAKDYPVFYGDAAKLPVLRSVGVDRARAMVIAVSPAKYATEIARVARAQYPQLPIFGRARDSDHARELLAAGVTATVPITLQASLELGSALLRHLDLSPAQIEAVTAQLRQSEELAAAIGDR